MPKTRSSYCIVLHAGEQGAWSPVGSQTGVVKCAIENNSIDNKNNNKNINDNSNNENMNLNNSNNNNNNQPSFYKKM